VKCDWIVFAETFPLESDSGFEASDVVVKEVQVKITSLCCVVLAMMCVMGLATMTVAGDRPNFRDGYPPLDPTLMGFKEIGTWYFLCTAPTYMDRIPPHYLTFGPPPVPYCPPPMPMAGPVPQKPMKVKPCP